MKHSALWMLNGVILGGILAVDKQLAVDQIDGGGDKETVDKIEDRGSNLVT